MSKTKTVLGRTLEEIKEAFAKEKGFKNWDECLDLLVTNREVDEIAHRYAQSQTQELTEWKESMMKVLSELDLQGIGNALELPLGSSIAPQVLPKIKELQERNEELVSMLRNCAESMKRLNPHQNSRIGVKLEEVYKLLTKYNHLNKK